MMVIVFPDTVHIPWKLQGLQGPSSCPVQWGQGLCGQELCFWWDQQDRGLLEKIPTWQGEFDIVGMMWEALSSPRIEKKESSGLQKFNDKLMSYFLAFVFRCLPSRLMMASTSLRAMPSLGLLPTNSCVARLPWIKRRLLPGWTLLVSINCYRVYMYVRHFLICTMSSLASEVVLYFKLSSEWEPAYSYFSNNQTVILL